MHKYFIACHYVVDRGLQYAYGDVYRFFKTYDHVITEEDIRNVEIEATSEIKRNCTVMSIVEISAD